MAAAYKYEVRLWCLESGSEHYWYEEQTTINTTIPCGTHPEADTEDFTIERRWLTF